jgi:nucleoside phosphorylase
MSDTDYVAAVKARLDAVIQTAIDWLNAQESKPWSSEEEQRCQKATRERTEELKPLIGNRLIQLAQKHGHPDPNCFGVPLVNALHALAWREGPRSSLRSIQDCYHYLIDLAVVVSGPTGSAAPEKDRAAYDPCQRQPETLGELERWMYANAAGGSMCPRPVSLNPPPIPGLDRLSAYCAARYGQKLSIETVLRLIGEYALITGVSTDEAKSIGLRDAADTLAPKAPGKALDDRQHAVVVGPDAHSPLRPLLDKQDRNSRFSALEPFPAEDLPLWEKLQAALAGLASCMKSRPDLGLASATDFHARLADSLKNVGVALLAVGLQDCIDEWDCPSGHRSYARNLLQFSRRPTPELVGRLLSQDAREPAFFDLMRRDIGQFAEKLLAATKPPLVAHDAQTPLGPGTAVRPLLGILTALDHEFAAVKAMLDHPRDHDAAGAGMRYVLGTVPILGGGTHSVVLALGDMGESLAAIHGTWLRSNFPTIKSVLMVGIAGGVPNPSKPDDHVRLGDVVVSDRYGVVQYDAVKLTAAGVEFRPTPRPPSPSLLHFVRHLNVRMLEGSRPWEEHLRRGLQSLQWSRPADNSDLLSDSLDPAKLIAHPEDAKRQSAGQPRVFLGTIGSSNTLLKDPARRDELRNRFGVKAIEMETAGLADAAWMHEIGYLGIRGICDYCDENKNDLWQHYAAMAAAAYARALLESMPTP